jgi:hypothetical protein
VSDKKSADSRLAKTEKTEFTDVIEYFSGWHNAEVGLLLQTLNKRKISCTEHILVANFE